MSGWSMRAALVLAMLVWVAEAESAAAQVVALGASNTKGKGVVFSQAYPAHLQRLLRAKGIKVWVRNAGISGNTTGQMLARLNAAVPKGTRVVVLQPGGNDRRRGIGSDVRQSNITTLRRRLAARRIRMIMLPNRLIGSVARSHPRPDGQHFLPGGYRALAARLVPQVRSALGR